eukprot:362377-Chlamydomonas_euryale.AAC.2
MESGGRTGPEGSHGDAGACSDRACMHTCASRCCMQSECTSVAQLPAALPAPSPPTPLFFNHAPHIFTQLPVRSASPSERQDLHPTPKQV